MNIEFLEKKYGNESTEKFNNRTEKGVLYEPKYKSRKFILNDYILVEDDTNFQFCILGELDGLLKLVNNDGIIFEGKMIFDNGYYYFKKGTEYRSNGLKKYSGEWKDGYYNGIGIDYYFYNRNMTDIVRYKGYFKNGKYDGHGKFQDLDGFDLYEGEFKNGLRNGYGKLYKKGVLIFEGNYKNDKRNGHGKEFETQYNNKIFEGNYKNDEKCGNGIIYCQCRSMQYSGQFKHNLREGYGISYNCQGEKIYQGYLKKGKYHGKGNLYDKGNLYIEGDFQNGQVSGFGVQYDKNGKKAYEGQWKESKYNGKGILYSLQLKKEGEFKNGVLMDDIKDMKIRQFLETGDKKKIRGISTKYLQKYSGKELDRKKVLDTLKTKYSKKEENIENNEDIDYDIFGNKIEFPCYGDDDGIYDLASMRYLFKTNSNGDFENITYIYNENNERIPNFPIMNKGKVLTKYECPSLNIFWKRSTESEVAC